MPDPSQLAPEVQERLEEIVSAEEQPRATELLLAVTGADPDSPAAIRLMLDTLALSKGSIERLERAAEHARADERNVLMWAETAEFGHWWHQLVWADPDVERLGSHRREEREGVPAVGDTAIYTGAPALGDVIVPGECGRVIAIRRGWVIARWEHAGEQRVPLRNVQRRAD